MAEPGRAKHPMEIVKETMTAFIRQYLRYIIPRSGATPAVNLQHNNMIHIVVIDTKAMKMLHRNAFESFSLKLKIQPVHNLIHSANADAATQGRYIQRVANRERDIVFNFRFSNAELESASQGHIVHDDTATASTSASSSSSSSDTSVPYTDFFWILSPLDLIIGNKERGCSRSIPYSIHTSVKANDKILARLEAAGTQNEWLKTIVKCGTQVGEYRGGIVPEPSPPSICEWIVSRDSSLHGALIKVFCNVEEVYPPGGGGGGGGDGSVDGAGFNTHTAPLTLGGRTVPIPPVSRHRVLLLRASLDQLNDETSAETYTDLANAYLERMKNQKYARMDANYRSHVTEDEHITNIERAATAYKTAWKENGFVCGMVHFTTDAEHTTLFLLDSFLHSKFLRKTSVIDGLRRTLRQIARDENVLSVIIPVPLSMKPDQALPVYDAMFKNGTEPLMTPRARASESIYGSDHI
jgi:hypothetical protein